MRDCTGAIKKEKNKKNVKKTKQLMLFPVAHAHYEKEVSTTHLATEVLTRTHCVNNRIYYRRLVLMGCITSLYQTKKFGRFICLGTHSTSNKFISYGYEV